MAMDSFLSAQNKPLSPSASIIIKKGLGIGAYTDSLGWSHSGLVRLAKEFGGHLVLVVGFEEEKGELKGFYVHHLVSKAAFDTFDLWYNFYYG